MKSILVALCWVLFSFGSSQSAFAAIYADENFEGPELFADRNWPVIGVGSLPTAQTVAVKGLNLRYGYDVDTFTSRTKATFSTTGQVTGARYFRGKKSLQLNSGQKISCMGPIDQREGCNLLQFAICANEASTELPVGTRVGYLKMDFSTDTTGTLAASCILDLRVSQNHDIDLICPAGTVAKINRYWTSLPPTDWVLLSLVTNRSVSISGGNSPQIWCSYDPIGIDYKGPAPHTKTIPPTKESPTEAERWRVDSGLSFFMGNYWLTRTPPEKIFPGWGSDGTEGSTTAYNTRLLGWEIACLDGAQLYIDDLYWDTIEHADPTEGINQEAAARMKPFDAWPTEPRVFWEPEAAGEEWALYE